PVLPGRLARPRPLPPDPEHGAVGRGELHPVGARCRRRSRAPTAQRRSEGGIMTINVESSTRAESEARIDALLDAMTLEEQVALLAGADFWTTVPIERLGIPAIKVSDGPNGARGGGSLVGGVKAACFPVGISLASTWNTELVEQVGQALAEETQSKG